MKNVFYVGVSIVVSAILLVYSGGLSTSVDAANEFTSLVVSAAASGSAAPSVVPPTTGDDSEPAGPPPEIIIDMSANGPVDMSSSPEEGEVGFATVASLGSLEGVTFNGNAQVNINPQKADFRLFPLATGPNGEHTSMLFTGFDGTDEGKLVFVNLELVELPDITGVTVVQDPGNLWYLEVVLVGTTADGSNVYQIRFYNPAGELQYDNFFFTR